MDVRGLIVLIIWTFSGSGHSSAPGDNHADRRWSGEGRQETGTGEPGQMRDGRICDGGGEWTMGGCNVNEERKPMCNHVNGEMERV
jgi:hypothetical protein